MLGDAQIDESPAAPLVKVSQPAVDRASVSLPGEGPTRPVGGVSGLREVTGRTGHLTPAGLLAT